MASTNLTGGRVSPIISELLLSAAQGNAGRYLAPTLPCNFRLRNGSLFKGALRTIPTAQAFGDSRVVGTSVVNFIAERLFGPRQCCAGHESC